MTLEEYITLRLLGARICCHCFEPIGNDMRDYHCDQCLDYARKIEDSMGEDGVYVRKFWCQFTPNDTCFEETIRMHHLETHRAILGVDAR